MQPFGCAMMLLSGRASATGLSVSVGGIPAEVRCKRVLTSSAFGVVFTGLTMLHSIRNFL